MNWWTLYRINKTLRSLNSTLIKTNHKHSEFGDILIWLKMPELGDKHVNHQSVKSSMNKKSIFIKEILNEHLPSVFLFYHTRYCNSAWKKWLFWFVFRIISKTVETILIKKIDCNHGVSVYKKTLISEHRKNYIFRVINCFVKMSVCTYVTKFLIMNNDIIIYYDIKRLIMMFKPSKLKSLTAGKPRRFHFMISQSLKSTEFIDFYLIYHLFLMLRKL